IPTMIWHDSMVAALQGSTPVPFAGTTISGPTTNTTYVVVPPVLHKSVADATNLLNAVGLVTQVATVQVASPLPQGTVLGATPGGGAKVPSGSTVTLTVSSGVPATPTATPTTGPPTTTPTTAAPTTTIS